MIHEDIEKIKKSEKEKKIYDCIKIRALIIDINI